MTKVVVRGYEFLVEHTEKVKGWQPPVFGLHNCLNCYNFIAKISNCC